MKETLLYFFAALSIIFLVFLVAACVEKIWLWLIWLPGPPPREMREDAFPYEEVQK